MKVRNSLVILTRRERKAATKRRRQRWRERPQAPHDLDDPSIPRGLAGLVRKYLARGFGVDQAWGTARAIATRRAASS